MSEKRYREVFENTSDCMFLLDVLPENRFKVVRFNPAEEKSVGITNGQAAGKLIQEILPPEIANVLKANFSRCVETGSRLNYEEQLDLPIIGLMCVPPLDEEPAPHFALLREIARRNDLQFLSMGMSADFETAIRFGATHVRVGSAIFGEREA